MKKGTGILIDENNDLKITVKRNLNGFLTAGFVIGNTTIQNQALLLHLHKGELKHAPTAGVGISDALLDHNSPYWRQRIRQEFEKDGLRIKTLVYSNPNELVVDANY